MSHLFYPRDPLIDSLFLWPQGRSGDTVTTVRYEVVTYPPPQDDAVATKQSGEAAAAAPAKDDAALVEKGCAAAAADTKKEESARIAGELREALHEAGFLGKDVAATKETAAAGSTTTGNACTAAQNVAAEFCERQRALLTAPGGPVDKAVAAARVQMEQLHPRAAVFVRDLGLSTGAYRADGQSPIFNVLVAELEKRGFHSAKMQVVPRRLQSKGTHHVFCHWDCPWVHRKAGTDDDPLLCTCGSMIVFDWWPQSSS
jgi:hypothetical protein